MYSRMRQHVRLYGMSGCKRINLIQSMVWASIFYSYIGVDSLCDKMSRCVHVRMYQWSNWPNVTGSHFPAVEHAQYCHRKLQDQLQSLCEVTE